MIPVEVYNLSIDSPRIFSPRLNFRQKSTGDDVEAEDSEYPWDGSCLFREMSIYASFQELASLGLTGR